jgi:hypothetical protein
MRYKIVLKSLFIPALVFFISSSTLLASEVVGTMSSNEAFSSAGGNNGFPFKAYASPDSGITGDSGDVKANGEEGGFSSSLRGSSGSAVGETEQTMGSISPDGKALVAPSGLLAYGNFESASSFSSDAGVASQSYGLDGNEELAPLHFDDTQNAEVASATSSLSTISLAWITLLSFALIADLTYLYISNKSEEDLVLHI